MASIRFDGLVEMRTGGLVAAGSPLSPTRPVVCNDQSMDRLKAFCGGDVRSGQRRPRSASPGRSKGRDKGRGVEKPKSFWDRQPNTEGSTKPQGVARETHRERADGGVDARRGRTASAS
jgi:hypothetical protein